MSIRKATAAIFMIAAAVSSAQAHEMFLRAREFTTTPDSEQVVRLINGTFDKSENSISRDRMANVSIVALGQVTNPAETDWYDDADSSYLKFRVGEAGTYVIGVSTRPNMITLSQEDFITYLRHDSILDTLVTFEKENTLTEVRERYSKHVRTIVQVGDKKTPDYSEPLGYPVEILLDQNPYDLNSGSELSFRVLFGGEPVADQIARVSYEGFHGHGASGEHTDVYTLRTDKDGRAKFQVSNRGVWFISLIHMQEIDDVDADYESNWATITFEVE